MHSTAAAKKRGRAIPTVIVDKSALFRAGLKHIVSGHRFRVAADCSALSELPAGALKHKQWLALVGTDSDGIAGVLPQISWLKSQGEDVRVIILSEHFHPDEWIAVIKAGAHGCLIKNEIAPDAFVQSLELVLLGGVVIPRGLSQMLRNNPQPLNGVPSPRGNAAGASPPAAGEAPQSDGVRRLSNREQMILAQLTRGASNKHIARELNIAEATVKVHVKSLLRKIRVSNRTQAALWAMEHLPNLPE